MRGEAINKITLTSKETDDLIKSLANTTIDPALIKDVFGDDCQPTCSTSAQNCFHCVKCDNYFAVNPDAMNKIKKEIDAKGIKLKNIDKIAAKVFR